jgi:hypothetical protein
LYLDILTVGNLEADKKRSIGSKTPPMHTERGVEFCSTGFASTVHKILGDALAVTF